MGFNPQRSRNGRSAVVGEEPTGRDSSRQGATLRRHGIQPTSSKGKVEQAIKESGKESEFKGIRNLRQKEAKEQIILF